MAFGPTPTPGERGSVNVFNQFAVAEKTPFDVSKLAEKFKYRDTGWTIPEAFLGIMFKAGMADGQFTEPEAKAIEQVASRSRALRALSSADLGALNNSVNEKLNNRSDALREACQTLPADMCLPIFAHCVDIVLSDGQLDESEAKFLQQLAELLDIEPDNSRRVMEVLLLKAQY